MCYESAQESKLSVSRGVWTSNNQEQRKGGRNAPSHSVRPPPSRPLRGCGAGCGGWRVPRRREEREKQYGKRGTRRGRDASSETKLREKENYIPQDRRALRQVNSKGATNRMGGGVPSHSDNSAGSGRAEPRVRSPGSRKPWQVAQRTAVQRKVRRRTEASGCGDSQSKVFQRGRSQRTCAHTCTLPSYAHPEIPA